MSTNTVKMTYADLATLIVSLMNGEIEITSLSAEKKEAIRNKAIDLLNAQEKKAEYNATHKSPSKVKGASAETMERANAIASVLSATPMTASEISNALHTDFTALQVANAVKYIKGVDSCKVIRKATNNKGLTAEKEYTAYFVK